MMFLNGCIGGGHWKNFTIYIVMIFHSMELSGRISWRIRFTHSKIQMICQRRIDTFIQFPAKCEAASSWCAARYLDSSAFFPSSKRIQNAIIRKVQNHMDLIKGRPVSNLSFIAFKNHLAVFQITSSHPAAFPGVWFFHTSRQSVKMNMVTAGSIPNFRHPSNSLSQNRSPALFASSSFDQPYESFRAPGLEYAGCTGKYAVCTRVLFFVTGF